MPRSYNLYWDKRNKVWFQYTTNPYTNKRTKHILGKARSRTNDYPAYLLALEKWERINPKEIKKKRFPKNKQERLNSNTIAGAIQEYLALRLNHVSLGQIKLPTYYNYTQYLIQFGDWVGPKQYEEYSANTKLNKERFTGYFKRLNSRIKEGSLTKQSAHKRWASVKAFYKWCWETDKIKELPRVFGSEDYRFKFSKDKIKSLKINSKKEFSTEEIIQFLDACCEDKVNGKAVGSWFVIALNCGWTITEIANLQRQHLVLSDDPSQVFTYIEKSRQKNNIESKFRLWSQSSLILSHYALGTNKPDDLIFKSPRKSLKLIEWVYPKKGNATERTFRLERAYKPWRRMFNKAQLPHRKFKDIRPTSATHIEAISKSMVVAQLFLAHTPQSVYELNYRTNRDMWNQELDAAVLKLPKHLQITEALDRFVEKWFS
jgi:integrase